MILKKNHRSSGANSLYTLFSCFTEAAKNDTATKQRPLFDDKFRSADSTRRFRTAWLAIASKLNVFPSETKYRCKNVCAALCVLLSGVSHAQEQIALKDLLDNVYSKAPGLISGSASVAIVESQANETRASWMPNLHLNYQADLGTNNNTAGPYFGFGIIPSNTRGVRTESNTSPVLTNLGIVALDWEVYNFGAFEARNNVAKSDIEVGQNQFQQLKYRLQAYTIGNYLQLLRLQDFLTIQSRTILRSEEIVRSIQSLVKNGVRPGVESSIAEAELSKARLTYIELDKELKNTQLQLAALSGLPPERIIPDTLVTTRLIAKARNRQMILANTDNHPVINYFNSLVQNSREKEKLVKNQYNPKVLLEAAVWGRGASVDANDNFNDLSTGIGFDRTNYLVGLAISYDIFDFRHRQLKLRTQKKVTDYAIKSLDEQKALLSLAVSQADLELNTAEQRLEEIPNQLRAAKAGYRQKLSLYNSGLTDIIELNAALAILYRAETDYAQARFSYVSALFQKAVTGNQVNSLLNLLN
ncbi:TolC family protein [Flavobacterium psychrotrophum]|uniref:TolC family protein n=1 Tax=Flavobacterium psychrotrophum TaxID=2294119 RepID=UPI000E320D53|nr:TolC family protein [Flavobacterium psychrotrophum]